MTPKEDGGLTPVGDVAPLIHTVRGERVLLDSDLARIYGVPTKSLNRAVKRNPSRFPADFVFQLATDETESLRYQSGTSKTGRGGRRYLPYAFTEHGAIMAATVLNSPRAVQMSVFVVRAFVRLRELLATHKELAVKLAELEAHLTTHDEQILALVEAIRQLAAATPKNPSRRRIGFQAGEDHGVYRVRRRPPP